MCEGWAAVGLGYAHRTSGPTVQLAGVESGEGAKLKPLGMELISKALVLGEPTSGKEDRVEDLGPGTRLQARKRRRKCPGERRLAHLPRLDLLLCLIVF